MKNLILVSYFFENSVSGANASNYVTDSMDKARIWAMEKLRVNLSNNDEYDTIYDLIVDKNDEEIETASIDGDGSLEYNNLSFRLNIYDESHVCSIDPITIDMEIDLS